ncbi:MAG: hypothetical protein ABR879_05780, partial [Methanomassiliicoccales archaeon]
RSPSEVERQGVSLDEQRYLNEAASFLSSELGCDVLIYSADDPDAPDPHRKARSAQPRRPAIYVE